MTKVGQTVGRTTPETRETDVERLEDELRRRGMKPATDRAGRHLSKREQIVRAAVRALEVLDGIDDDRAADAAVELRAAVRRATTGDRRP